MKLTHIVLACQVNVFLLGKEIFSDDQGSWNWFEAQSKCKSENSRLREDFPKQVNSTETFAIWRGVYRRISVWIKILGCYTDNTTEKLLSTTVHRMSELSKSAGFCQEICMSSNLLTFAIKGNLCGCLERRPEGKGVPPLLCNALCYAPGKRVEKPYFDECGGKGTYSVYLSGPGDERKPNLPGTFCVAIQCSATTTFHFKESCSENYQPVCQLSNVSASSGNWSESMQLCKSLPFSSYLTGEVSLNNITSTCDVIGREVTRRSWLGVANEVYYGIDQGHLIKKEDTYLFNGCQLCKYENKTFKACPFEDCNIKQNSSILCMQKDQDETEGLSSQTTNVLHTSTLGSSHRKPKPTTKSIVSSSAKTIRNSTVSSTTKAVTTTSTSTAERTTLIAVDSNKDNEQVFQVIIPIAIAVGLGGVICALILTYLCYWKKQIGIQKQKPRHEEAEGSAKRSNVKGIINYGYFTVELQEQVINSSNLEQKLDSPFMEAKDDTYDHLRGKESRNNKDENQYNYDTTRNIKAKIEQDKQSNDGTYDRLGDERCGTNTDDTYHHAFTTSKERSEYDITEIRKQNILNSPYSHVMRIVPAESDTEQDDSSNTSEEMNEDHPDFILEQD